ncbi:MAG: hypothetical protein WCR97_04660 [Bacilli bacterium]
MATYTIHIEDNQIQTQNVFIINSFNDIIHVSGNYEAQTMFKIKIKEMGNSFELYLPYIKNEDTNIFGSSFYITKLALNKIKNKKELTLQLYMNNVLVDETQTVLLNKTFLEAQLNSLYNPNDLIHKENIKLHAQLVSLLDKETSSKILKGVSSPGMVPVAISANGIYQWDYINRTLETRVKQLTELVSNLSDQNSQLTTRVNELNKTVTDHIYEQNNLI